MVVKEIIGTAALLAAAVEAEDYDEARRRACEIAQMASAAELQQLAESACRVLTALTTQESGSADLGGAIIVLADEIDCLIKPP